MDNPDLLNAGIRVLVRRASTEDIPNAAAAEKITRQSFITGTLLNTVPNPYNAGRPEHNNHVWRVRMDTIPVKIAVFNYEEIEVFE
jgi:hypothetical protein